MKNINFKMVTYFVLLTIVFLVFQANMNEFNIVIRKLLESKSTANVISVIIVAIYAIYFFGHKLKNLNHKTFLTDKFGEFVDIFGTGIGYATAFNSVLTMIKGLYIQLFFGDVIYYAEFDKIDLVVFFSVLIFLLIFFSNQIYKVANKVFTIRNIEETI